MSAIKSRLHWRITQSTAVCLIIFVLSAFLGWMLPPDYGKENGPIEWSQVIVLGLAAVVAVSAFSQSGLSPLRRKLYAWTSVVWVMAIARELSWGRVFYMNSVGGMPPLKALWFGPYVYPALGAIAIIAFVYFFTKGLHKELVNLLKYNTIPAVDIILILFTMLMADIIEHRSFGLFGSRTVLFEELAELISYCGMLSFMMNMVFSKHFIEKNGQSISLPN